MNKEFKRQAEELTRSFEISAVERAEENAPLVLEGYAAVFNTVTELWPGYNEMIDAKAFEEADLGNVVLNVNHNDSLLLARTKNGSLTLSVDNYGLKFRAELLETADAKDIHTKVEAGLINECSFRFRIGEMKTETKTNSTIEVITKITKVSDVSLVTFPAYDQGTSVQARKNAEDEKREMLGKIDATIKTYII